jgi:hypothetical protein
MARVFKQAVESYNVPVRAAHPLAVRLSSVLGTLTGNGINGHTGTVLIGQPAMGTRNKYGGYLNPLQQFLGWNPNKVAAGHIMATPGRLPGNGQGPNNVLDAIAASGGNPQ